MKHDKQLFFYRGPVYYFKDTVLSNWATSVYAVSLKQAKACLEGRYKRDNGYTYDAQIHVDEECLEPARPAHSKPETTKSVKKVSADVQLTFMDL